MVIGQSEEIRALSEKLVQIESLLNVEKNGVPSMIFYVLLIVFPLFVGNKCVT